MKQKTMGSDEARVNFRDVLDAVSMGETIFVERYGKPVAVVVSVREYERF
jgi:prevent-host-death family protein